MYVYYQFQNRGYPCGPLRDTWSQAVRDAECDGTGQAWIKWERINSYYVRIRYIGDATIERVELEHKVELYPVPDYTDVKKILTFKHLEKG